MLTARDFRMRRISRIHFIGIGGAGMGGVAEVLLNKGYQVTGSDQAPNLMTKRLQDLGAQVVFQHQATNIQGADVVVVSSAIAHDNPELIAATNSRIPVVCRAEMLAELMRFNYGIAIAGTHGKTTTTSLMTALLTEAGEDPTYVIGGKLNSSGTHACLGEGGYFVAEADESDASFLYLYPMISIVTNIDQDHMETYENNYQRLQNTFIEYIHHLPFYGLAVLCRDDPGIQAIIPKINRPMTTYGICTPADWQAVNRRQVGIRNEFTVINRHLGVQFDITLNLAGEHNVLNALAAIAVASDLKIPISTIQAALTKFSGVGRRFQYLGKIQHARGQALVLDDYGHHPSELGMVVKAAREVWPGKRLVMIYQPHRYSRTRDLFTEFVNILGQVEVVLLLDIYSASELPIPGVDSQSLIAALQVFPQTQAYYVGSIKQVFPMLELVLQDEDILIIQGAGDISNIAKQLSKSLVGYSYDRAVG